MSNYQTQGRHFAGILVLLLLAASATAEPRSSASLSRIRIKNFGRVNDNYYRGAQPQSDDYADLAAIGVKTVIDLTYDGRSNERVYVEKAGMKFYRIPLVTSDRPTDGAVIQFLKLVT